jgi:trigger factor
MQVTVQRISPVVMELHIEVPADAVKTEVEKAYLNLAKKAHVKGFRPGKTPRNVLTHLFGSQVQNDVANSLVNGTLPKVLTDNNVSPIGQPRVEAGAFAMNEAFKYKALCEVQPEIENVVYEGFELYRPKSEATEAMVDEQLESLRVRQSSLKAPEPARPATKGDVLSIDFTLALEGKDIKDGGGNGVQIELGAGQALPELDAALSGKNVGDKVSAEVTFADDHQRPDFRGKKAIFNITINDLKERTLPALDDELAKDIGSFDTLVALRADIHSRLEAALKEQAETALAEQLVEKLNVANPIDVPPTLVEQQCKMMENEVAGQARRMGQRFTRETAAALHGRIHADAERKVRAGLLMAAIARKQEFKVTDEDIEQGYKELAEQTGKNVAKVKAEYREKSKRDVLIGMILEDKILDYLESKSTIIDGPPPAAAAEPPPAAADAKSEKKAEAKADTKAEAKSDVKASAESSPSVEGEKKAPKAKKKAAKAGE